MIPKIIHYAWFGGKPLPADAQKYIDQWHKLLPDYEIRRWDETNFPLDYNRYTRQAAQMKAWAFVSDVCRLYALDKFGGIYLDTDIELIKTLDPMLGSSFIGEETTGPCCGVMAARAGETWVRKMLDYYDTHHFIGPFGHPNRTPNPLILQTYVLPGLTPDEMPAIYPKDVFYPDLLPKGQAVVTPETVAIHHYAATWRGGRTLRTRILTILHGLRYRWIGR
ncbi:MAG: glycosyl transferase [Muribaculaceae bacterium]|nr:glycosyl transferase [Muribaculaceae bacterium]